jgi:DNA-binding MarR family transcriptional regulator
VDLDEVRLPLELATRELNRISRLIAREGGGSVGATLPVDLSAADDQLLQLAQSLLRERLGRQKHLKAIELGEPQWDMALDLYVSKGLGKRITVSSLCLASGVPATTALRHISSMVSAGIVLRQKDKRDARLIYISLSPETHQVINGYLRDVLVRRNPSPAICGVPDQHGH